MKCCPKCNTDYFDNMLEFCLEDGSKLFVVGETGPGMGTATEPITAPRTSAETVSLGLDKVPDTIEFPRSHEVETRAAATRAVIQAPVSPSKILDTAPLVIALAHNWWQWLYLEKEYVSSIPAYILSANFLMWFLLLVGGILVGMWSLKRSTNRVISYASLVMLAINLILFIVPRR